MVNLFGGKGFIGSHYSELYPTIVNDRNDYVPKTNEIFYLISTIDNYNVYTNPYIDIDTNLTVLIKVLENCKNQNITFNFASSWFVYDTNTTLPAPETAPCRPKGFYSITKYAAEQLLVSYCQTFGINYRILRFGNVLGPGDLRASLKKNVLTHMIKELKSHREIKLWAEGNFCRDYIHVKDLCRAVNLIIEKGEINSIYNISSGIPTLFKDAIDYTSIQVKSKSNIILDSTSKAESFWLNIKKLQGLGFQPTYSIWQIIDELISTT